MTLRCWLNNIVRSLREKEIENKKIVKAFIKEAQHDIVCSLLNPFFVLNFRFTVAVIIYSVISVGGGGKEILSGST